MRNHYERLGVQPDDDRETIWRAYLSAVRSALSAEEPTTKLRALDQAWEVLRDPASRTAYDRALTSSPAPPEAPADTSTVLPAAPLTRRAAASTAQRAPAGAPAPRGAGGAPAQHATAAGRPEAAATRAGTGPPALAPPNKGGAVAPSEPPVALPADAAVESAPPPTATAQPSTPPPTATAEPSAPPPTATDEPTGPIPATTDDEPAAPTREHARRRRKPIGRRRRWDTPAHLPRRRIAAVLAWLLACAVGGAAAGLGVYMLSDRPVDFSEGSCVTLTETEAFPAPCGSLAADGEITTVVAAPEGCQGASGGWVERADGRFACVELLGPD